MEQAFLSTIISPTKEKQLDKIKQIVNHKIKPISPARRRTRSQDQKETTINTEQTLKRLMDNTESEATSPKRPNINEEMMMVDDISLSPGWNRQFQSTIISPTKEKQLDKIKQIVNHKIKPISPARRRTRSQDQKETTINTEQILKNSRTRSQDPKETPINNEQILNILETQPKQVKTNPKVTLQIKQNARAAGTNKSINKGRTPKQNQHSKTKDNNKEQNKED